MRWHDIKEHESKSIASLLSTGTTRKELRDIFLQVYNRQMARTENNRERSAELTFEIMQQANLQLLANIAVELLLPAPTNFLGRIEPEQKPTDY